MGQAPSDKPTPLRNSYWVVPGKVLAGEHPGGTNRDATRERLKRLTDAGVECFIDLTEPGELKPYDPELPFSIEYLRKPIKDHGTPSQRAHMAEILDCIHDALQSGRCVYIHCRAGIGRTGTVVGCFLVERGLLGEAAVDELNHLWQQNERSHSWPSVPETPEQTKYITSWKPRGIFDDRGSLTTSNMLSSGSAPDDDPDDAPSPGGADRPWAHLMGDTPSSSGPNSTRTPPAPARAPGATRPGRAGSDASAADSEGSRASASTSSEPADRSGANRGSPKVGSGPIAIPAKASRGADGAGGSPDSGNHSSRAAKANAARAAASQSDDGQILSDPTSVAKLPQQGTPRSTRSGPAAGRFDSAAGGAQHGTAAGGPPRDSATARRDADAGNAPRGATASGAPRDSAAANARRDADAASAQRRAAATSSRRAADAGNALRGTTAASAPNDPDAANTRRGGSAGPQPDQPSGAGRQSPGAAEPSWISANARAGQPRANPAAPPSVQQPSPRPGSSKAAVDGRVPAASLGPGPGPGSSPPTDLLRPFSALEAPLGAFQGLEDDDSDPLLSPEALAAVSNLRDRFIGALIGLAVGDAVSAATQYRRPGSFTPVGDMLGGGPFDLPRGGWSDDTSMALCLADSLLARSGFDARDQVERYRRWQTEGYLSATGQCVGITASSAKAIAMAQWRRQAFFGSHDPSLQDPEPLSRVTPAVLFFFATSGEAVNQATEAARTTCQAPAVLDACRALASAVYAAISGQPKAVVLAKATLAVDASAASGAATTGAATAGASGPKVGGPGAAGATTGGPGAASGGPGGGNAAPRVGITAPAALAAAVQAFAATDNFRDAILFAANLGGDSDVVTAACGQLAGAYYTVKAIPTSWLNGLMQKELILGYADRLLAHAMVGLSG